MQSIFFLFIFVVSFCCGAFAQNVSDEAVSTESSGKSLDASSSSTGAMDTEVVPKADIPEAGEPASSYKGDESYGGEDSDLPPKENSSADTKDLVTDDGAVSAGDYDKLPKSMPDSGVDADAGVSNSGEDMPPPAQRQSSDNYGE